MKRIYEPEAYDTAWPDSHWRRSAPLPVPAPRLEGGQTAEVAVIGAGYAGLSAAHELATRFGIDVAVVDAVQPGWGASGRNGGFCCFGATKLSHRGIVRRVGVDGARDFHRFGVEAIEGVGAFLDEHGIDARQGPDGEASLAHSPSAFKALVEQAKSEPESRLIGPGQLASEGMAGPGFHGALVVRDGFPLHPMLYVEGLAKVAAGSGVRIFGDSPVLHIARQGAEWRLDTPEGSVTARTVLVATNGYSSEDIPTWLGGRNLPTLSSIMVTRPMTEAERQAQGFTTPVMSFDTRTALHYFRHLPDGRFLFGMRGGTSAAPAATAATQVRVREHFDAMFPAWRGVETESRWAGFVCLTGSLAAYVGPVPGAEGMYAAFGWHGSGVAPASQGGRLAARLIAGANPQIPDLIATPPRRFPVPAFRRTALATAYMAAEFRDGPLPKG
ncbi:NAD(P)/FAD-dependent oxidoreductase [Acidimangrovimonas sediminis]|uniref:NAD(P)/FAD-dependent oxidoreductase n=1 Tax=Acidimangrovimonas sediminis TaxID=2056283 RepID=UPI000C80A521|nr:FAD-binding oxidoreductase [Acidimangrovimonas sediminis]